MKESIESIWKQGFVDDKALIAPKINDLYNQKSQNIVDKLQYMFDINLKGIVIGAIILLVIFVSMGLPFLGLFFASVLMATVVLGKKHQKQLQQLDKNTSSYAYLKSFDVWLKSLIIQYTQIYRVLYPALFLGCMIRFRYSEVGESIIVGMAKDFPGIPLIFSMPVVIPAVVALLALLLSYFSAAIYRVEMNVVYGSAFKKLEEILTDMETLQK
jgi:hypothetical protein